MGALSPMHLLLILGIAVLVLGPRRLPEAGEALGRALREFREAVSAEDTTADSTAVSGTTASTTPAVATGAEFQANTDGGDAPRS